MALSILRPRRPPRALISSTAIISASIMDFSLIIMAPVRDWSRPRRMGGAWDVLAMRTEARPAARRRTAAIAPRVGPLFLSNFNCSPGSAARFECALALWLLIGQGGRELYPGGRRGKGNRRSCLTLI